MKEERRRGRGREREQERGREGDPNSKLNLASSSLPGRRFLCTASYVIRQQEAGGVDVGAALVRRPQNSIPAIDRGGRRCDSAIFIVALITSYQIIGPAPIARRGR